MKYSYVLNKIKEAPILDEPFKHVEINNLFNKEDFEQITNCPEISINADSDEDLFSKLFKNTYRIIHFPGCTQNYKEYISWHKKKKNSKKTNTSCEGYGVVLRLESPESDTLKDLLTFLNSQELINCVAEKFNIDSDDCTYDAGIQKYLDGYEISPHPDIRKKAATYMVNLNPSPTSDDEEHHTSYQVFKPEWQHLKSFWEGNKKMDRCWVPWDWCTIVKQQTKNNSIVLFSPDNDTLHAVKAKYNHLPNQRTQLYGNLWHKANLTEASPRWEDYVITPTSTIKANVKQSLIKYMPSYVFKSFTKIKNRKTKASHGNRQV